MFLASTMEEREMSERKRERGDKRGGQALSNKDNEWELYGVSFKKQKKRKINCNGEKENMCFCWALFLCLFDKKPFVEMHQKEE